ncbi:RecX family transcriptional regulator, partial [Acidovorax cattleyae]
SASARPPETPRERARQMRFLAARGFPGDVVRRVVGGRMEADDGLAPSGLEAPPDE